MFKDSQYTRALPDRVKVKMAEVDATLSNRPNVGLVQLSRALGNQMEASKTSDKLSHTDEVSKECQDSTKELVSSFLCGNPPLPIKRSHNVSLSFSFNLNTQFGASRRQKLEEHRKAKGSQPQAQQTVNVISQILLCCRNKIENHKKWFQDQVCCSF
jgi:hypothetical protein